MLKNTVEMVKEQEVKTMSSRVDMGCNFYIQAEVEDTNNLIVDIGKGIFVELTQAQTVNVCDQKQQLYGLPYLLIFRETSRSYTGQSWSD